MAERSENNEGSWAVPDDVTYGEDPTQAILSKSALHEKSLCDFNINTAVGCSHGCTFCYVPSTPQIRMRAEMLNEYADVENPQEEWGEYVLHRPELMPHNLAKKLANKRSWNETEQGRGIVAMSFGTDCYQDIHTGRITTECLKILSEYDRPNGDPIYTRILTRNPVLAAKGSFESDKRFMDIIEEAGDRVTIGSSIPCYNAERVKAIEPNAPPPQSRLEGLQMFNEHGVTTYVSMSPTYPTQTKDDLRTHMRRLEGVDPDVIFHEPINPRGENFKKIVAGAEHAGDGELAAAIEQLQDKDNWFRYAFSQLMQVQQIAADEGIDVHLWPDEQLTKASEQCDWATEAHDKWAKSWRNRPSVEDFSKRPDPTEPMPSLPEYPPSQGENIAAAQQALDDF